MSKTKETEVDATTEVKAKASEKTAVTYSKDDLIKSKTYKADRDLLTALLDESKKYSKDEVKKIIEDYKKGKVN